MVWLVGIGLAVLALFAFPKQSLILVGALVLLIGGPLLWWWGSSTLERQSIEVRAALDPTTCKDPRWPVGVVVQNNNARTLRAVSFHLDGRLSGRSGVTASGYESWDFIVPPRTYLTECYSVPDGGQAFGAGALGWSVSSVSPTFG